jgi:hypothetical protein
MIREVRDLLPVIADKHFDPLFDGFGSLGSEHATDNRLRAVRKSHAKPKWQRQLSRQRVSPSDVQTCAKPTHENSTAAGRSNGLSVEAAAVVSVKATGRQVPMAEPEGMMPHPADLTEKVSAVASEAPAIPDLLPSRPGWQERAARLWSTYEQRQ